MGSAWKKQAVEWRDRLEITKDFNPLSRELGKWRLCGLQSNDRVTSILNLVACEKTKGVKRTIAKIKSSTRKTIVDVSQNPSRKAFTGKSGVNHTLCSSTIQVHMGLQRQITPREMMFQQGHSPVRTVFPKSMPMTSLRKLAGQGMALPCVGTCLWSMFLAKGFPKPPERDSFR